MKVPATFISELAALPDDQQETLARLTQDQFDQLLIQSELSTLHAAESARQTGQIKALIHTLVAKVDTLTTAAPGPEQLGIVHNLPYISIGGLFKGRETILAQLKEQLNARQPTAIVQPQTIRGIGGIGKTRLAIEFAWWALNHKKVNTVLFVP
ncbi:MAG: hypothetical protein IIA65_05825, partial [Planctomycetes bacterium]|nr:hypothetical protein [Planctomycetota bacterium]